MAYAERKQKLGYGVTKEAQNIFDALSKTLPCKWRRNEIVVMESVIVPPPYTTVAPGGNGDKFSRERVQKVLTGEWNKMAREEQQQQQRLLLLQQQQQQQQQQVSGASSVGSSNHNTAK